jgi:hypothetical protein
VGIADLMSPIAGLIEPRRTDRTSEPDRVFRRRRRHNTSVSQQHRAASCPACRQTSSKSLRLPRTCSRNVVSSCLGVWPLLAVAMRFVLADYGSCFCLQSLRSLSVSLVWRLFVQDPCLFLSSQATVCASVHHPFTFLTLLHTAISSGAENALATVHRSKS